VATASSDGQTFEGQRNLFCGLDGNHGPFAVAGQRCPASGCPTFTPTRTPTPTHAPIPSPTPDLASCVPDGPCNLPDATTRLLIRARNGELTARWRWSSQSGFADFGNPTTDSVYHVCLQTPGGQYTTLLPAVSGWSATRSGFVYTAGGGDLRRVVLKSTPRRTSIAASFKSASALTLPLTTPVTLRLIQRTGSTSACFESVYNSPDVSTDRSFRASQ
jgi:hypothetical protein